LSFDVRVFERTISDLPESLGSEPEFDEPLKRWKTYLETTKEELNRAIADKGGVVSAAQKRASEIASEVQVYIEAVRLLEEQCETDIKNHPTQEKEIRRRYRQAIDALTDG
jgi:hypothetical protein